MIQVTNLIKAYNKEIVLNIPELTINKGEVFGLVGNNGAGKTTFFNLLLDLIVASKGSILNTGIEVSKSENWKEFTGAFIDESFIIGYLSAEEYFSFVGELRGMNKTDIDHFLTQYTELFNGEILGKKKFIRDFSKGNQKKTGIVAALMGNPQVVVLDEPFGNLDPGSQFRLRELIKDFSAANGTTFLISDHTLDNIADVCSRIVILEKGKIVRDVTKTETTLQEIEAFFKPEKQFAI
ncbi:MAG: ATP-binding protein [Bacteroidetes bacterium GWF2_42_66]|nr:MAG: ATP-binding protein [Bacteroidetes bacterium GWA2_42_15]OFY01798.1 MAG: ATP-binding protein [Bacteroidetes bacterium GWE2_42_39]OFY44908.1 MAG: ATP-binding protein [Bacteroidetes bacterium GWF2_42_66]HBL76036.1 ATP-binding protein [Prolixibacteraceae bacterium]HCR89661.1 ATP-binding protein [Prolixibacteraceae bacterium]